MKQAKWIWYKGDYEIFHSTLLHSRRDEFGFKVPPMWQLYAPYPTVSFEKSFKAEKSGSFKVISNANGFVQLDGKRYILNTDIQYTIGEHNIYVLVTKPVGMPCIYCQGDDVVSDRSWMCGCNTQERIPAGDEPEYTLSTDDPEVFKFEYQRVDHVSKNQIKNGVLFDFGKNHGLFWRK